MAERPRQACEDLARDVLGVVGIAHQTEHDALGFGWVRAVHADEREAVKDVFQAANAARKRFTREQLREAMRGIEYRDTDAFLDEIPQAYKDIDVVMADAADLVRVRHTLRQLVNVKGD